MRMYDVIQNKRDCKELTDEEIKFFIQGYTKGEIPDYQAAALCMAIFFNGMNKRETATLTMCMRDSGEKANLSMFNGKTVDKHSTGGVGDKTTLIVAPIVASLGCYVAKMSGRGLGHTGGTVDKLESISGYQTSMTPQNFIDTVKKTGVAVVGQTGNFAPADKKLYSLRDVTATVDSIPLIASSIMSKKLAAGADVIVLDVKAGSGAFMKTPEMAEDLAKCMVSIGSMCGKKTSALITNMDTPLGENIGNALEVKEAIEVLKGKGSSDLREICLNLSAQMIALSENIDHTEAMDKVTEVLDSGKALEKFKEWISAQGGDIAFIDNESEFCKAKYSYNIKSQNDGYISFMNAEKIGKASVIIGAGRNKKEDNIDYSAGIVLNKKTGDHIKNGDVIATLYSSVTNEFQESEKMFLSALDFSDEEIKIKPLIYKIIK